jgi:aminoglycoside/choline kinase family phosphotransferase
VIPLPVVHSQTGEHVNGRLVLDALGDRERPQTAGDPHHGRYERAVALALGAVSDELSVDLEVVKRQVFEVVQGSESSPEVVEGEPAAELGELVGERGGSGDV